MNDLNRQNGYLVFGVVLYEMLTGQLPFKREGLQGAICLILNKMPESLSALRPDIARHLELVVAKALEKDVLRRYQNRQELIQDLKPPSSFQKICQQE